MEQIVDYPWGGLKKTKEVVPMKLQRSYTSLSDTEIIPLLGALINNLENNPNLLSDLISRLPTLDLLKQSHQRIQTSYSEALSGGPEKDSALKADRDELNRQLAILAGFVQVTAGNDPATLSKAGYQGQKVKSTSSSTILTNPTNFKLHYGTGHGSMFGRCGSVKGAKGFMIQVCEGDPTIEANWKYWCSATSCTVIEITGLTPGTVYSFRIKAIAGNRSGGWSSTITMMAI